MVKNGPKNPKIAIFLPKNAFSGKMPHFSHPENRVFCVSASPPAPIFGVKTPKKAVFGLFLGLFWPKNQRQIPTFWGFLTKNGHFGHFGPFFGVRKPQKMGSQNRPQKMVIFDPKMRAKGGMPETTKKGHFFDLFLLKFFAKKKFL